jgi:hypothetical protein
MSEEIPFPIEKSPPPAAPVHEKTTAPTIQPGVFSALQAADKWGIWYGARPALSTYKNRPPYSLT